MISVTTEYLPSKNDRSPIHQLRLPPWSSGLPGFQLAGERAARPGLCWAHPDAEKPLSYTCWQAYGSPAPELCRSMDRQSNGPARRTGLILQDYGLLPWANLGQNAGLGMMVRRFYGPDGKHAPPDFHPSENVDYWLDRLGIAELRDQYPGQISGGQRQRTAIARTLALNPDLLLMDEPFSSLDAPTRESLQTLTLELQAERSLTLVIVTHAIEEAAAMGRRILLLGHPPISQAAILENPEAGRPGFRSSRRFLDVCQELRFRLEIS